MALTRPPRSESDPTPNASPLTSNAGSARPAAAGGFANQLHENRLATVSFLQTEEKPTAQLASSPADGIGPASGSHSASSDQRTSGAGDGLSTGNPAFESTASLLQRGLPDLKANASQEISEYLDFDGQSVDNGVDFLESQHARAWLKALCEENQPTATRSAIAAHRHLLSNGEPRPPQAAHDATTQQDRKQTSRSQTTLDPAAPSQTFVTSTVAPQTVSPRTTGNSTYQTATAFTPTTVAEPDKTQAPVAVRVAERLQQFQASNLREQPASATHPTAQPSEPVLHQAPATSPAAVKPAPIPAAQPRATTVKETPSLEPATPEPTEIVGWPLPETLMNELEHLQKFSMTQAWAEAALQACRNLNQLELVQPESLPWIQRCAELARQLHDQATALASAQPEHHDACSYMIQVAYRMRRRAEIWSQIHLIAAQNYGQPPAIAGAGVAQLIAKRTQQLDLDQVDPMWVNYLFLDKASEIFQEQKPNPAKHQAGARKVLARLTSSSLDETQRAYAQQLIGDELGTLLRDVATGPLDLGQLLQDIEDVEAGDSVAAKWRLNSHFQNYYWNQDPKVQVLANLLDDHYRNANLRIEFSQELVNRMIPSDATTHHQPVTDRILGANVFGQSRVTNRIQIQLVPAANRLSFRLRSNGRVLSSTRAHSRGFTFSNLGNGLVHASKIIAIGKNGIMASPTTVDATSENRLLNVQGQMDNVPLFGGLARRMAQQQHESQGLQAKQIVEYKMRNEFRTRIDEELQVQVDKASQWFNRQVLDPLQAMELEPAVVQLQTTGESAIVRYRLAALDQNAADSPRPQPMAGSLANFQIHRSAINNLINQIQINGNEFTPQQFLDHLSGLLGRDDLKIPEEQNRHDVTFAFASRDAVTVDFEAHSLAFTLRVRKIQIGTSNRWKNLIVQARYLPTAVGQRVYLRFDEDFGLRVDGRLNLADQVAVRTVFSSLFKPDLQLDILPPEIAARPAAQGLGITELLLSDGWLSVSLQETPAHGQLSDQRATGQPLWQWTRPSVMASRSQPDRLNRTARQTQGSGPSGRFYQFDNRPAENKSKRPGQRGTSIQQQPSWR